MFINRNLIFFFFSDLQFKLEDVSATITPAINVSSTSNNVGSTADNNSTSIAQRRNSNTSKFPFIFVKNNGIAYKIC